MQRKTNSKRVRKEQDYLNTSAVQSLDNLITNQEEKFNEHARSSLKSNNKSRKFMNEYNEEQEEMDIQINDLKKNDSQKMALLVGQLIAKNKINAKNAFEVPLLNINQGQSTSGTPYDIAEETNDNIWKRFSSTLDSNHKIYGYRVDATHNYTYRVLESITRQEKKDNEEQEESQEKQEFKKEKFQANAFQSQFIHNEPDDFGKQLQKNYRNINILHLDTFFNVNPVLEKTKRIFDQNGLKGLLFNNLQINEELALRITLGKDKNHNYSLKKNPQETIQNDQDIEEWLNPDENIQKMQLNLIFRKIEYLCRLNKSNTSDYDNILLIKRQYDQIQQLWRVLEQQTAGQQTIMKKRSRVDKKGQTEIKVQLIQPMNTDNNYQINITSTQHDNDLHHHHHLSANIPFQLNQDQLTSIHQPYTVDILQNDRLIVGQILSDMLKTIDKQFDNIQNTNESLLNPSNMISQANETSNHSSDQVSKDSHQNQSSSIQKTETSHSRRQISSYIKINKRFSKEKDFILRQITDIEIEQVQRGDIVSKWKSNQARKAKAPRVKREQKEVKSIRISFYEELQDQIIIQPQRMKNVFKLDKFKKKQLKSMIKQMKKEKIIENNIFINTSLWKINYKLKTYLRQFFLKEQNAQKVNSQHQEQQENQEYVSLIQANIPQYIDISSMEYADQIKFHRNVSIRQAKEKIHKLIFSRETSITFSQVFYSFNAYQGNISAALCFLTVLHLINQHGLQLQEMQKEYDFTILLK